MTNGFNGGTVRDFAIALRAAVNAVSPGYAVLPGAGGFAVVRADAGAEPLAGWGRPVSAYRAGLFGGSDEPARPGRYPVTISAGWVNNKTGDDWGGNYAAAVPGAEPAADYPDVTTGWIYGADDTNPDAVDAIPAERFAEIVRRLIRAAG